MNDATENQNKLYELLADYAVNTILGMVSRAHKAFGRIMLSGDALPQLILPVLERYFNYCAHSIQTREDDYVNSAFDAMCAIPLTNKNHPMDNLQLIVLLSLNCLRAMEISDLISDNHHTSMEAVKHHLRAVVSRYHHLARELHGCTQDHIHEPLQHDEKIFTFTLDNYVQTAQGPVKLTRLEW